MSEFTIRPATADDIPSIEELCLESNDIHYGYNAAVYLSAAETNKPEHTDEEYTQIFTGPDAKMFVAEVNKKIIGLADCKIYREGTFLRYPFAKLNNLVVTASMQSRGHGTKLIQTFHDWARSQGVTEYRLDVDVYNSRAKALYDRLGYQVFTHEMRVDLSNNPHT